ncbi:MAG: indole-3-glycerol phosphate synthase TrpC [Planctomyces sp.]|nr:indole-3-glycerol phosphate synthase TrpC [Planctomyces sp.]
MADILQQIVEHKREEISAACARTSLDELKRQAHAAPPPRNFAGALRTAGPVALIAEVKKASPSAGVIREDFDPVAIARIYADHGATCLSVLTDERFFQGHLDFLRSIRAAVDLPVLRKDFILDEYQVVEARAAGADAVLLIAECLPGQELAKLDSAIRGWGMQSLVELYEERHLDRVLALGPELVGVNNRDLRSFVTDLGHAIALRPKTPAEVVFIAESGIRTAADVERLRVAGIDAMLVGESLMREPDIGRAAAALLAGRRTDSPA